MNKNELSNTNTACEPITTFIKKLIAKGFILLSNGDYIGEPFTRPNDDSLFFRLESPMDLERIDLSDDSYYLANWGRNTYMCECHYHMVKLVSAV